jgi:predicted aspartyl protease
VSTPFNPTRGLVVVRARIEGPDRRIERLRMAIDTGATSTCIRAARLLLLGIDVAAAPERRSFSTATGVEFAARVPVPAMWVLGQKRVNFPVLALPLPQSTQVDGLLGLDFFRDQRLTIDFQQGRVTLE